MNSTISTFYSWNPAVYVGFVFKKVEMTPFFFNRIMDGTVWATTFGARKFRSFIEIYQNVKLL